MAERWSEEGESLPREAEGEVPEPVRGEHGRWVKGTPAPNPGGYSKAARAARLDVREAARQHTAAALKVLVNVMQNEKAPPSARVQAAEALINRGWGRPRPDDSDGEQITIVIRRILEGRVVEQPREASGTLPAIEGDVLPPDKGHVS